MIGMLAVIIVEKVVSIIIRYIHVHNEHVLIEL